MSFQFIVRGLARFSQYPLIASTTSHTIQILLYSYGVVLMLGKPLMTFQYSAFQSDSMFYLTIHWTIECEMRLIMFRNGPVFLHIT